MTPEQRDRLEYLKSKKGQPVREEPSETPIHLTHAHYGGPNGYEPCACPAGCIYCGEAMK